MELRFVFRSVRKYLLWFSGVIDNYAYLRFAYYDNSIYRKRYEIAGLRQSILSDEVWQLRIRAFLNGNYQATHYYGMGILIWSLRHYYLMSLSIRGNADYQAFS